MISIQWQFQVKPSFAQTCEVFPQFETLSRPRTHTHTHIHTPRESRCSELTGQHTVKTTGLDASIVDKISQCLGLRSTTIFTKCNYQTCFISKARRCSPFKSRPSWKQCFTKSDKSFEHNITQKITSCILSPQDSQSTPIRPPLPMIPPVTGTYTGRKKKTLISEMRITCG